MENKLYNNLSGYFRERYGRRIKKICIDGGFSCPNRDGRCSSGGCIYCGERGSGEHIDPMSSIGEQVRSALEGSDPSDLFAAYFQNFTNTYAPKEVLRARYDAALIDDRIKLLAIGTRPDCIDEDVCALIAEYKDRCDVWVELGLQTANDKTADIINRGYHLDSFERAVKLLSEYEIPIVVHLILGLPGESFKDIKNTAEYISRINIWGIKIHSMYVMKNTVLAQMYERGEYTPPTLSEYAEAAVYVLTHISPDIVVHRITGDCPRDELVAPAWNSDKHRVIAEITSRLISREQKQGYFYTL